MKMINSLSYDTCIKQAQARTAKYTFRQYPCHQLLQQLYNMLTFNKSCLLRFKFFFKPNTCLKCMIDMVIFLSYR